MPLRRIVFSNEGSCDDAEVLPVKWLLTVLSDVDTSTASARLAEHGATVEHDPIPLDANEQVFEVDGPADLPARLSAGENAWVKRVNTNSEQTPY